MLGDLQRFDACLPFVLSQECPHPDDWSNIHNFSNDPHDPGGHTMCGITQREYDHYRKIKGWATRDVRQISRDEGDDIYLTFYWMPHCQTLQPGLDLSYLDASVNEGAFGACKVFQTTLGLASDGMWGPKTDIATKLIDDVPNIIRKFGQCREEAYKHIPGFRFFGDDWIRRTREIKAQSLTMAMGR